MKTLRDIFLGILLAAALLCLFMAPAFAGEEYHARKSHRQGHKTYTDQSHLPTPSAQPPITQSSSVLQVSATKSSANSASNSASKSNAAASAGSKSASSSYGAGGASSLTDSGNAEVVIHGDTYEAPRLPVASAIAGGTNTTADCRYSVGAGGQATVLGLSLGFGRKDKDCFRLQLADRFYDTANPDAGDVIMCRIKELREAFGADCLVMLRRSRLLAPSPGPAPTAHQLEEKRAFERGEHLK